jgi:hypothetical protein
MFARRLSEVSSNDSYLFLRTFVITAKLRQIVMRRAPQGFGNAIGSKASLGSLGFVKGSDKTMFSEDPLGVTDASLRTLSEQLSLTATDTDLIREGHFIRLVGLLHAPEDVRENSIAVIALCRCPEDFDPIAKYIGGEALYWHPIEARFNNIDALDPWSRELLELGVLERVLHF